MLSAKKIAIGSRSSKLALAQASQIKDLIIKSNPQYQKNSDLISIHSFKTTGDIILDKSLSDIGGKGLFTKEIEEALLEKKIDIAVHSMKDMPASYPEGLDIFAIPEREDVRDAFISKKYDSIFDLPEKAIVGTSSSRRKALLLKIRPDLNIINFRGNINTRLKKIDQEEADATILAVAGLKRINMEESITSTIQPECVLPAVAQGAIGAQARKDDDFIVKLLDKINHKASSVCVDAERAFLKTIGGSCKTPMAAYCQIINDSLYLRVLLCSPDGKETFQTHRHGSLGEAIKIGNDAGMEIKNNAQHILNLLS